MPDNQDVLTNVQVQTVAQLRAELLKPFPVDSHNFKPQAISRDKKSALAPTYVDSRYYQDRLDQIDPSWSNEIEIHMTDKSLIMVATLTVLGSTRTATGECAISDSNMATSAEAQAFKRACAAHGLGRYLYHLPKWWGDYDDQRKRFTDQGISSLKAKLASAIGQPQTRSQTRPQQTTGQQTPHPVTQRAPVTAPKPASVAAQTDGGKDVGPTDFWTVASPMIGSKFPSREAVQALVQSNTTGGQVNWAAALQALN